MWIVYYKCSKLLSEVLDSGLQLCTVLDYLHSQQPPIVFRDLKPANIMRTPTGQIYLIDFGIARYFKPGQAKDTVALGSLGYAAAKIRTFFMNKSLNSSSSKRGM